MSKDKTETYVKIGEMTAGKTEADPKLQKEMPDVMTKAITALLTKTAGVTFKPQDEKQRNYAMIGNLESLTKEPKGKEALLTAIVKLTMTEFPSGKRAVVTGRAKIMIEMEQSPKQLKADAAMAVAAAAADATKTALKDYILKK